MATVLALPNALEVLEGDVAKVFVNAENTPLVRTDFSDEAAWTKLIADVQRPSEHGFVAHVEVFDDEAFSKADALKVAKDAGNNEKLSLCIVADTTTMTHPERPLLCVELGSFKSLRVVPAELHSIENNLSIANMDFEEFADAAGDDGVFRGFE